MPLGMAPGSGIFSPPGVFHVLPPSSDRWSICPNQPLVCDAKIRFGSTGDPFRWYISQPAKCGPLTSHFSRLPSEVRTNAPLRVPTSNRTVLISRSLSVLCDLYSRSLHFSFTLRLSSCLDVTDS